MSRLDRAPGDASSGNHTPPPAALDDPLLGTRIGGQFLVQGRLAKGAHGTVYRGEQSSLGRAVAIKVLAAEGAVVKQRFAAEARILSRLRHPNTVSLIGFGHLEDGRPYLVSPLVDGETLQARLRRGPLDPDTLVSLVNQVAGALGDAHEQGVVHRDLKPANLLLEKIAGQVVVRVIDFGVAQQSEDIRLTAEDHAVGTAAYMSPEQIRGERVDPRSDIYSLGVVAYECLAGRLPFTGPNRLSVVLQHLNDPPPPLPGNPELAEIITWCLAKRPSERPADTTALIEALAELGTGELASAPAPRPARWLVAGLVLGMAVVGALAGWMAQSDTPAATPATAPVTQTPTGAKPPADSPSAVAPASPDADIAAPPQAAVADAAVADAASRPEPQRRSRPRTIRKKTPEVTPSPAAPMPEPKPPSGLF